MFPAVALINRFFFVPLVSMRLAVWLPYYFVVLFSCLYCALLVVFFRLPLVRLVLLVSTLGSTRMMCVLMMHAVLSLIFY